MSQKLFAHMLSPPILPGCSLFNTNQVFFFIFFFFKIYYFILIFFTFIYLSLFLSISPYFANFTHHFLVVKNEKKGWNLYDIDKEFFVRQNCSGALWRKADLNQTYSVSPTYPKYFLVPNKIDDEVLLFIISIIIIIIIIFSLPFPFLFIHFSFCNSALTLLLVFEDKGESLFFLITI